MEQLVARWAHNPKVTGSSPVLATIQKANMLINNILAFINTPSVTQMVRQHYLLHQQPRIDYFVAEW